MTGYNAVMGFVIVFAGLIYVKSARLDFAGASNRTKFIADFFLPVFIFKSSLSLPTTPEGLVIGVTAVIFFILSLVIALAANAMMRSLPKREAIISASLMNCGYIGIPMSAAFGDDVQRQAVYFAVFYTPIILIVTNWSLAGTVSIRSIMGSVFDKYIVAMVLGVSLSAVQMPQLIIDTVNAIAAPTPFLMLFVTGVYIGCISVSRKNIQKATLLVMVRVCAGIVFSIGVFVFHSYLPYETSIAAILQSLMPIGILPYFILSQREPRDELGVAVIISTALVMVGLLIFPFL